MNDNAASTEGSGARNEIKKEIRNYHILSGVIVASIMSMHSNNAFEIVGKNLSSMRFKMEPIYSIQPDGQKTIYRKPEIDPNANVFNQFVKNTGPNMGEMVAAAEHTFGYTYYTVKESPRYLGIKGVPESLSKRLVLGNTLNRYFSLVVPVFSTFAEFDDHFFLPKHQKNISDPKDILAYWIGWFVFILLDLSAQHLSKTINVKLSSRKLINDLERSGLSREYIKLEIGKVIQEIEDEKAGKNIPVLSLFQKIKINEKLGFLKDLQNSL